MTTQTVQSDDAVLELGAAQWDDLYIRHNFGDTGLYPTPGSLCESPDIIPAGLVAYQDPSQLISDPNWNKDFGNAATARQPNYVYVRGRNLGGADTTGKVYLYAVRASAIMWPTAPAGSDQPGWADNPIKTQQGNEYVSVQAAPAARFVTMEPFQWIPDNIVSSDHYCLCSRVVTPAHPNPIPTPADLNDLAAWISNHPDVGWHNILLTPATTQVFNFQISYAQGAEGGDMIAHLVCENCPDGSEVQLTCDNLKTDPPFQFPRTTIKNTMHKDVPTFMTALPITIPDDWSAILTATWWTNNQAPLPDMPRITLDVIMPIGSGWDPALDRFMRPLEDFGIHPGQVGPTKGLTVGRVQNRLIRPAFQTSAGTGVAGATVTGSSFVIAGFAWEERSASVIDQRVVPHDVAIQHLSTKGVPTEVLRLTGQPKVVGADIDADLTVDVALAGAPEGDTEFDLFSRNVPVGCEIWFKSLDGSVDISAPPTKVTQESVFGVSELVTLPADYAATIRMYLLLNGNVLPPDWSLQLMATQLPPGAKSNGGAPPMADGGPRPGTLLGSVTAKR
jgi:hypothetical protein